MKKKKCYRIDREIAMTSLHTQAFQGDENKTYLLILFFSFFHETSMNILNMSTKSSLSNDELHVFKVSLGLKLYCFLNIRETTKKKIKILAVLSNHYINIRSMKPAMTQ
jgi:hypothetical protein